MVFPDSMTPLAVGQERSIQLVDEAVANDSTIALVTTRNAEEEATGAEDIYDVGTAALIHKMIRVPDGTLRILVQGVRRVRLERIVQSDPYLVGEFSDLPDVDGPETEVEALARNVEALFSRVIGLVPYLPDELQLAAANAEDPSTLANLIATTMRLKTPEKQELLEEADIEARLRKLTVILNRELEVLELGTKIQSQVQSEMEHSQREYFLRQQLKAIQEELGEGDEQQAEISELRGQIEEAHLPEEADRAARRELDRLAKLPPAAAEYGVIRGYLEWILSLPWNEATEDNLDLEHARLVLDEDHYDLEKVKDRIIEQLAVSKLKEDVSGPILCFVGPPGVGKTSLGQSIARSLGRKFARISVGGVRDEAEIRGHRRTYIGALPGTILRALRDAGSRNPVFMIDEIDKMGSDWRGDPSSAMLEVLDPAQNSSFRDHYLDLPFDLSKVLFICTANQLETIPPPLQDRMEIIRLSGYTEEEKLGIAKRYLVPKQLEAHGLDAENVKFGDKALRLIISEYTREAGVRNLDREIAAICRKAAAEIASGKRKTARVDERRVRSWLGRPALPPRDPQAHFRPRRGHGPGRDAGRRRHPLHRGDRRSGRGPPHRHGPARRGHARVRAGRPLLGARACDGSRARGGLVRAPRRPHPRSRRSRAQGRPVCRNRNGDGALLARDEPAGLRGGRHDRRDHAHRPGAPDRRAAGQGARRSARRHQHGDPAEGERGGSRRFAARRAQADDIRARRPCRRCDGGGIPGRRRGRVFLGSTRVVVSEGRR